MKLRILLSLSLLAVAQSVAASDVDELTALLHEFLAGASTNDAAAHERFWAVDLMYTSSRGTQTNKAAIMAAVGAPAESDDESDIEEPIVVYSAEDLQVQVYGGTAVIAFRLVGTPQDGADLMQYFNTGTFLKRDGIWKAVAWQATQIPKPEASN